MSKRMLSRRRSPDFDARRRTNRVLRALTAVLTAGFWLTSLACSGSGIARNPIPEDRPLPENLDVERIVPSGPSAQYSVDGLVLVPTNNKNARLYIKPPRPHLQRFDKMVLMPTILAYKKKSPQWNERDERAIRMSFRRDLISALEEGEIWPLVDQSDATAMLVRVSIADLDIETDHEADTSSSMTFVTSGGGAVIGVEIFDDESTTPLMRYMERHRLPGGVYSGGDIDLRRVQIVFREFAKRIGSVLRYQYRIVRQIEKNDAAGGRTDQ
jgi:hypothetical protein